MAVSKGQPAEAILAAHAAGLRDFGENYVQEAVAKMAAVRGGLRWHFIGNIQSNKTRQLAEHFDWVHTVAAARVAARLAAQRPYHADPLQVCLQIRPRGSNARGGIPAEQAAMLAAQIATEERLRLRGIMIVPLPGIGEAETRREYARTRELYAELRRQGHALDTLSMGMSGDLELAIAEGSTMIRIGTALFGPRPAGPGQAAARQAPAQGR